MENEKILEIIQKIAEEVGFDLVGIANTAISDEQLACPARTVSNEIACPNDPARTHPFSTGGHSVWRASSTPLLRNDNAGSGLAVTGAGEKLDEWVKNGYYADMKWFADSVEKRKDILKVMPDAKSVICVAINYYNKENSTSLRYSEDLLNSGTLGKIARYAHGRDYHKIFDKKLKLFVEKLEEEILRYSQDDKGKELKIKYYSDTGPILERAWAVKAGLGFIGKNTNLITKYGSWVLLGEIITNIELSDSSRCGFEETGAGEKDWFCSQSRFFADPVTGATAGGVNCGSEKSHQLESQIGGTCGSCRKCLDACPTGALCAPYTVDARKCISYLTIEHKGDIPMELREKMGNRIFGCDACQEVCPFNIGRQKKGGNFELTEKAIAGNERDLKEILSIKTDEEFLEKFAGSPVMRAKRKGLVRNACIVAGNSKDKSLLPYLRKCLKDDEPIIVEAVMWAIEKIEYRS